MTFTHATIGTKVTVRLETQTHAFITGGYFVLRVLHKLLVQSADNIIGVLGE